jgi:2-oxoglutarate ferredoxin oxidoreductase subunit alpha
MHGDAPHIVIAPHSISDTVVTGGWAVALAEALQTVVIVLSDQRIGQSIEVLPPPGEWHTKVERLVRDCDNTDEYYRYYDTASGVSAMAVPGDPGGIYTAEGLEHNQRGTPSPRNADHLQQLEKRQRKLLQFDFGDMATQLYEGQNDSVGTEELVNCLLICWGSVTAATQEAADLLVTDGHSCRVLCLRLLSPLPQDEIEQQLKRAQTAFIIEQNHRGQLFRYIRSQINSSTPLASIARPGPVSISSADIISAVTAGSEDNANAQ